MRQTLFIYYILLGVTVNLGYLEQLINNACTLKELTEWRKQNHFSYIGAMQNGRIAQTKFLDRETCMTSKHECDKHIYKRNTKRTLEIIPERNM